MINGTFELVEEMPKLLDQIDQFSSIQLNEYEREAFAESASLLRWDEYKTPIMSKDLLRIKRSDDNNNSIWHTFNRVQENLMQGVRSRHPRKFKSTKSRKIKSVTEDIRLNKGLWKLAEAMKTHKT